MREVPITACVRGDSLFPPAVSIFLTRPVNHNVPQVQRTPLLPCWASHISRTTCKYYS